MKSSSCLKLVGMSVLAVSVAIVLQQPGYARKKPRVTVTTPSTSGSTVVPTVPTAPSAAIPGSGALPPGAVICVPGGPSPCVQPQPTPAPGAVICVPGGPAPCAQPQPIARDYFFCGRSAQGLPTTYVNTPSGNVPLIRWVSHYFEHSGYSPEVRCQDVSQRFNRFYNQGVLNFVTTGFVNNQPVVCVASDMGGPCQGVLFTLKSGQNATRTIQQLFDVRAGASGPLFESDDRIYVDMKPYTQAIQATR